MEINVRDDTHIIHIWLANDDRQPELINIKNNFPKHTIAIFKSGKTDLLKSTENLILKNKNIT